MRAVLNSSLAVGGVKAIIVPVALAASLLSVPPLATDCVAVKTGAVALATVMIAVFIVVRPCPSVAVQLNVLVPAGTRDPETGVQATVAPNSSVAVGSV